jgi:hypothetical protein
MSPPKRRRASVVQFTLRVKFLMFNNLFISVNLVCFQQFENYQRRSPEQKHFGVKKLDPAKRDPRFDHDLIGNHQVCRIGT